MLAIEDKPKEVQKTSNQLLSEGFKNYVPKKSRDQAVRDMYDLKRAKEAENKQKEREKEQQKEREREMKKAAARRMAAEDASRKKATLA